MFDIPLYVKFFVSIIALINPIGIIPIFISLISDYSSKTKKDIINRSSIAVFIVLLISLIFGKSLLTLLGITLESFKIAGGLLVILIAITMVNGKIGENKQNKEEKAEIANTETENISFTPLAIPLMAGPGSISAVIAQSSLNYNIYDLIGFIVALFFVAISCYLALKASDVISDFLGQTGINIITRVMGILLMAIGVELIISGFKVVFIV